MGPIRMIFMQVRKEKPQSKSRLDQTSAPSTSQVCVAFRDQPLKTSGKLSRGFYWTSEMEREFELWKPSSALEG
jgi:hypothetical protein